MAKLTKRDAQLHRQACQLVDLDRDLTDDERWFVLEHWHETAATDSVLHGAFFTPMELAREFRLEIRGRRIIDLGAGIGRLSWFARHTEWEKLNREPEREIVCVERNPEYVRVGRKILPEARWICGDILDVPQMGLGHFSCAIGNPPFGPIDRGGHAPTAYRGRRFEYHTIGVAAKIARHGAFIVPQNSAPFRISGRSGNEHNVGDDEYHRFVRATGIELHPGLAIDTNYYRDQWRDVTPVVEIVTFENLEPAEEAAPEPATPPSGGQLALLTP